MKLGVKTLVLGLIVPALLLNSCKKDEKNPPDIPPPSGSFIISTDDYENNSEKEITNWFHAATHVGFWQTVVSVTMAVPVAAFSEAVKNHEPVSVSDNRWMWAYDFKILVKYEAKLYGELRGDSVDWEMYISKTGAYSDFLWYTGTCDINGTGGYWELAKSPDVSDTWLRIDWARNGDETGYIRYSGVLPDTEIYGDYINAEKTNDFYNAGYDIYNAGEERLLEVEWNTEDKSGRVKDFKKYEDENWHCWDENLQDITCSDE